MDEFRYRAGVLHAEDVPAVKLAERFGTPLYAYSRATLLHHYRAIEKAFAPLRARIHYSVKACPNLSILRLLREAGAGFDVVSEGELRRSLEAGARPDEIVFAGVGKADAEIQAGLEAGILQFNVESESELERLDALARAAGRRARVAIRVNPDVDPMTHRYITTGKAENKFGVDLDVADQLVDRASVLPGVELRGLHIHIGSQILSTTPFEDAVRRLVEFADAQRGRGRSIEALDLGGGFGIHYREPTALPADTIAAALVPLLAGKGYRIALEPGRFIAGNAGILLARVLHVKSSGPRRFVIVDAAMNDLIRPALYGSFHWVWPARSELDPRSGPDAAAGLSHADIVGPICESGDFLARDLPFPDVETGDCIAVFSAGAYGMSMASNYNTRPRAAEVLVDGAEARLIRRRETYDDLVAPERGC